MPYVKGVDRNQTTLFPKVSKTTLQAIIRSGSLMSMWNSWIWVPLNFDFATAPSVGRPPYDPKVILKLYLYGCLNRIRSSRRLEHEAKRNVELLWLLEKQAPDFKTIADFRKNNKTSDQRNL
jgi:hypothetical protein